MKEGWGADRAQKRPAGEATHPSSSATRAERGLQTHAILVCLDLSGSNETTSASWTILPYETPVGDASTRARINCTAASHVCSQTAWGPPLNT